MADTKISGYSELAEAPAATDEFVVVDKSDTTMASTGTTKRVQAQYLTISDASTTVKGKVELATDAETITGTDTARAVTPSNLTAKIDTDGTLSGNLDTKVPSQKAVKTYADTKLSGASPTITTPKIVTSINDSNGNEVIKTPATASAVNEITVTNAATGNAPLVSATGNDSNIHLDLRGKGNGLVKISVLRQDNASNSYKPSSVILTGITGNATDNTTTLQYGGYRTSLQTVTFGVTFASAPIVIAGGGDSDHATVLMTSRTTTQFQWRGVSWGSVASTCKCSWIAIGELS